MLLIIIVLLQAQKSVNTTYKARFIVLFYDYCKKGVDLR